MYSQTKFKRLVENINELAISNDLSDSQVTDLNNKLTTANTDIKNLQSSLTTANTTIKNLQTQLTALDDKVNDTISTIADISAISAVSDITIKP